MPKPSATAVWVFLLCGKIQRRKKNGRKSGKSYTPLCENSRISKSVEKLHTPGENGVVKPFFNGSNESCLRRLALRPFFAKRTISNRKMVELVVFGSCEARYYDNLSEWHIRFRGF